MTHTTGVNDDEDVRELLGRAVDGVPVPAGRGGETVFARAARLRFRRRAAVTAVTAAVVAAGVVLGAGGLPDGRGTSVAASPTGGDLGSGADAFAKLLPSGAGEVREVSLVRLVKQAPKTPLPKDVGPYDGDYAVERDGGTGYVTVRVADPKDPKAQGVKDWCAVDGGPERRDCRTERLPDGGALSIWQMNWTADNSTQPRWGTELTARLRLKDGTVLNIRDSTGFEGAGRQGPLLKTFPLTREELRALALRPELLP
jgi:hypothetical protein